MNKQEKIKTMYFNERYKPKEIAEKLNVSNQYVSRTLLNDNRYKTEKEQRKMLSKKDIDKGQQTILRTKECPEILTQNMNI